MMRLLVVEGNTKEVWREREVSGGVPYHKHFQTMLNSLRPRAEVTFSFPADSDFTLPSIDKLKTLDGVLWTGSSLYVNESSLAVQRQLMFAEDVFRSGVPFYGSCWGLQIATVVAGGKVGASSKGREIGITQPIQLTEAGSNHPYFQGRKENYAALCIHLDEIIELPEDSTVLAKNDHSEIQALTIRHHGSEFFGVQYHPEFLVSDLAFIAQYMSTQFIKEGLFESEEMVADFIAKLKERGKVLTDISNYLLHTQEVKYWVEGIGKGV